MESAERSQSVGSTQAAVPGSGGIKEWLWRGNALDTAKAAPRPSTLRRERLRRARLAAEFADRAVDPAEPLRDGSSLPLAISLYREAAYWVLLAHSDAADAPTPPTLRELFDSASYPKPALGNEELGIVRAALIDKTFVEIAEGKPELLCREADLCQAFVYAAIHGELDAQDRVATVLIQRWVRVGVLVFLVAAALFTSTLMLRRSLQGPDLALGKPWRASSKAFECHPKDMECGGARSAMFFHTAEEEQPWVEIDLGSPQTFGRVEVVNREDCCLERAAPLIVEISDDRIKFREIARNKDTFREWEATFTPVKARYVRFRVDRRSTLHLIRVTVRPS
jgi:hypothetical protein